MSDRDLASANARPVMLELLTQAARGDSDTTVAMAEGSLGALTHSWTNGRQLRGQSSA